MAVHAILVSQTFSENQPQRSGRTEPFRLSGLRTFCCIWCKALLRQHKDNWEGLSKQVSIMLLGMQNVAFLHRKQFESWCKSTCKLKNGWENCNQSYSFTDSRGILTRRNFFVRISCFAWNRRHFFFRLARRHASRRFRRFRHLNLSTVCTHSLPQIAGILRALCVICAPCPLRWATGTRYLCVTKIFLLTVIITFKLMDGAPCRVALLKLDLNRWTGGAHHSCYSVKNAPRLLLQGKFLPATT